jgi:hypothetical protein
MEEKVIVRKPPKSPALSGILSFFFPFGVGPLYNGQYLKALIYFLIFAGLVSMQPEGSGQPFFGLLLAGFYIFQIFDSVQTSRDINRRFIHGEDAEGLPLEEFPKAIKTGSIFWGAMLMVLGVIFLLANFEFFIDYETIFDLWPVAVILIGIKLIFDHLSEKKS